MRVCIRQYRFTLELDRTSSICPVKYAVTSQPNWNSTDCRWVQVDFWHVIYECFSFRRIISLDQRYRKTSNFRKSIVRNKYSSKKWSNGIKPFEPMTRAGMNFDRLACWRNGPSTFKWSDETVPIVSWRHVKYLGIFKVGSSSFYGSTAPQEKPSMSPHVTSMWGMKKFTVRKHVSFR